MSRDQAKVLAALEDYVRFLREDLLPRAHGDFAIGKSRELGKEHPTPEELVPTTRATLEGILSYGYPPVPVVRRLMFGED